MNQALTATVIAIALILVPMSQAYASDDVEIIDLPSASRTWILIIAPDCDYTDSDGLRLRLAYNNTGYEAFLSNRYEVSCFTAPDIAKIESDVLPALRSLFPSDAFIFAFGGASQERDYKLYALTKYPYLEYATVPFGNADIERGYALARVSQHSEVQHERAHLETCSAHLKGSDNNDASTWVRMLERPWCENSKNVIQVKEAAY